MPKITKTKIRMAMIIHPPAVLTIFNFITRRKKMAFIGDIISDIEGGTESKNVVKENISAIASVINEAVQNCSQTISEEIFQNIDITGLKTFGNVDISAKNMLMLKEGCLQSEQATNQLDQALQSAASQTATAIIQQLPSFSSAKSKNIYNINAQIASSIKNEFVQNCSNTIDSGINQNIKISDSEIGGSLVVGAENYVSDLVSCSTKGDATNKLSQQLILQIQQEASAKVENFFLPFVIALALIIGIIALFLFLPALLGGRKPKTKQQQSGNGTEEILRAIGRDSKRSLGSTAPSSASSSSTAPSSASSSSTAPRAYRSSTAPRSYRSSTAPRAYRSSTAPRAYRSSTASRAYRSSTASRAYRSSTASRA